MILIIRITTSIPISLFNGWIIAGVGYGEHTGSGFYRILFLSQVIVELYNFPPTINHISSGIDKVATL
jgi:hypothetical protein